MAFPDLIPITLPTRPPLININPYWLSGFIDAEGCFTVSKKTSSKNKLIHSYPPIFELTQDGRDKLLLKHICQFFNSGNIYQHSNKKAYRYMSGSTRVTGKARFTRLAAEKSLIFRPRRRLFKPPKRAST